MKSFGIFFIAYQERFKSSASEISMILTITNLTTSFTGKLMRQNPGICMYLTQRGNRCTFRFRIVYEGCSK